MALRDADVPYEEDLLHSPYDLKAWIRYIEHKKKDTRSARYHVYERALKHLPGSYKLWHAYLTERVKTTCKLAPLDPARKPTNEAFERALVFMHKMPRIWLMYLDFLLAQPHVTSTRRTFDRCLRSLPVTQHHRIWPLYLQFIRAHNIPETSVRVFRRYLKLEPNAAEEYVDYLISIGRLDDAATQLCSVVNSDSFVSTKGKTKHQLWVQLCELVSKNPDEITQIKVEPIIRAGLRRFTDMIGALWCSLADYYIRQGLFEKARDVFEESINTVMTVRDFSQVFDAYSEFEESIISAQMEQASEDPEEIATLELRVARFEHLMDRRPLLLNSVLLRQNPHQVQEWINRTDLLKDDPAEMVKCFAEAVATVDAQHAVGKPQDLWTHFAKIYEERGDLGEARAIFDQAVNYAFRGVDDLADVWCAYAEMEIRHKQYKRALAVMRRATAVPSKAKQAMFAGGRAPVQMRAHRSLRLWTFYVDLEESLGTFESTCAAYDHMLELRVATPQIIINYAYYLEENKYFERAFTVYERGVDLFRWPIVFEIWNTYLVKFVKRYEGTKVERARELFEHALTDCPPKFIKTIYLLYASFEEEYGLAKQAMAVYKRATQAVPAEERLSVWEVYIRRAKVIFGVTHTRELYAAALEELPDKEAVRMAIDFAALERKLGEIDRARAIYSFASQMADPRVQTKFWETWHNFEVSHGNEDTFREMLRLKRSVEATFSTKLNIQAAMALGASKAAAAAPAQAAGGEMAALEARAAASKAQSKFVKSGGQAADNRDEIDLGDDDDEDDEDEGEAGGAADEVQLEQQFVPDAVFGSIAGGAGAAEDSSDKAMGAKARLMARKK